MRLIIKTDFLILAPDDAVDIEMLRAAGRAREGHVFRVMQSGPGLQLVDLGPEEEALGRPINITAEAPPPFDLISNFAHTPFVLDGTRYASVEGFWQSLRVDDAGERARIATLSGSAAKRAAGSAARRDSFIYADSTVRTGTYQHWRLMRRAVEAKFAQNEDARAALLATGTRPLTHKVRSDSRTIPGVVMAEIWMTVRRRLQRDKAANSRRTP